MEPTSTQSLSTAGTAPAPPAPGAGDANGSLSVLRRHPWPFVCVGVVIFSTLLLLWAGTSPGFDPYGWLVWGYQTLRLNLNLGGAPSWKPVTFLFTVPYALFGHLSYWLWMITSISIALGGPIAAGRIVYRIVSESSDEQVAGDRRRRVRRRVACSGSSSTPTTSSAPSPIRCWSRSSCWRSTCTCAAATAGHSRSCGCARSGARRRGRSSACTRSGPGARSVRCAS